MPLEHCQEREEHGHRVAADARVCTEDMAREGIPHDGFMEIVNLGEAHPVNSFKGLRDGASPCKDGPCLVIVRCLLEKLDGDMAGRDEDFPGPG